jgi:hypothetical protein
MPAKWRLKTHILFVLGSYHQPELIPVHTAWSNEGM